MKIAAGTAATQLLERLYDGEGTLRLNEYMGKPEMRGAGRRLGILTLPQGTSIGQHQHVGECESYYILQGRGMYLDNDIEYELNPGDFTLCRDGEVHGIKNLTEQDLVMYIVILNTVTSE